MQNARANSDYPLNWVSHVWGSLQLAPGIPLPHAFSKFSSSFQSLTATHPMIPRAPLLP
jgi:hypothetical protein